MNSPWRKAIRDFRQESTRTLLVVLAIAIGISAFAAVLSTYAVLTRELNKGYLATNPASATLRMDAIDDGLITALLADHDLSDADARRVIHGQIKTGPVQWRNLLLFVVRDYGDIRISKVVPEQGAWPPAIGEVLIERDAFQVARARVGDIVTVRIGQGKEQALKVSGRVHDVGQAQARMENSVYGYITLATLAQLGEDPYLDRLNILVSEPRFDEKHIRSVAEKVTKRIESRGHTVRRVDIPEPGKHPHADLMGALLMAMSSFGFFVLILSGILVVNQLMALMAAQVRQIGVMKTTGGTRWQVARIYLGQALFLGIAALLVASPLAVWGSRRLCRSFGDFLNFDITSFAPPLWVYLVTAAVGLVVPVLAAAWPIWKGSAVTIREALSDFGTARNAFGAGILDRILAGIGGRSRLLLFSIRNSFRRRTRLVLTLLTLAAAGVFFMSGLNIRASMITTLDRFFSTKRYDLIVWLRGPYPSDQIERALRDTPGVARFESWFMADGVLTQEDRAGLTEPAAHSEPAPHNKGAANPPAGSGPYKGSPVGNIDLTVIALPPESRMTKREIAEGRDLQPGDMDAVVITQSLASKFAQMKIGNTITLHMGPEVTSWHVVGISREPLVQLNAYIPQAFIEQRHPGMRTALVLALNPALDKDKADPASIYAITAELDRRLGQEGIRISGSRSTADSRIPFDQHLLMIYVFLVVVSGIIVVVGALGLATSMSLNVMERRREIGVLRAIGARPSTLWLIITTESAFVAVVSWGAAALIAWPVSKFVGDQFVGFIFHGPMDFRFPLAGLIVWLVVSVHCAALASFLPARSAIRLTVR